MNILRIKSTQADPIDRANMVREEVKKLDSKTVLEIGWQPLDMGTAPGLHIPPYGQLVGEGTPIVGNWNYQQQCQIELSLGSRLRGIRFRQNAPTLSQAGVAVGFSQSKYSQEQGIKPIKGSIGYIDECEFFALEYCLYIWGLIGAKIVARKSKFVAGKIAGCVGQADGPPHFAGIDAVDCEFISDSRLGNTGGASNRVSIAFLARGGNSRLVNCPLRSLAFPIPNDDPKNLKQVLKQSCAWLGMADWSEAVNNLNGNTHAALAMYDCPLELQTFAGVEATHLREGIGSWPNIGKSGRLLAVNCEPQGAPFSKIGEVKMVISPPFPKL